MTTPIFPTTRSAIYKAIALILDKGPQTVEQLMTTIDFGAHGTQKSKIRQAIEADWIFETPAGTIDVTERTRQHFAAPEPKVEYVGQITPAQYRGDWRAGEGLSKKNIPSRHGLRPASDSAPTWSHRESLSIKTVSGGDL
jgi:hypothetical protein